MQMIGEENKIGVEVLFIGGRKWEGKMEVEL